jgi:hypothetical protein
LTLPVNVRSVDQYVRLEIGVGGLVRTHTNQTTTDDGSIHEAIPRKLERR